MFDGSSFWASGQSGDIFQSELLTPANPPVLAITPGTNPLEVRLEIHGKAGESWDLLHATALPTTTWERLTTITLQNNTEILQQNLPANGNEHYFQLREPGP
jgi:hypothetical protein